MQFSQKETTLMKDLKGQEKLCADKYTKYSNDAKDPQLKNLFSSLSSVEQQHYSTLCGLESGSFPQSSGSNSGTQTFSATYTSETQDKKDDCFLCSDVLSMEKQASHLYDTCIFEFKDEKVRQALNSIQKDEQGHGKAIYDYMSVNGMYS